MFFACILLNLFLSIFFHSIANIIVINFYFPTVCSSMWKHNQFYTLTLYPAMLLNLLIHSSRSFVDRYLGTSYENVREEKLPSTLNWHKTVKQKKKINILFNIFTYTQKSSEANEDLKKPLEPKAYISF